MRSSFLYLIACSFCTIRRGLQQEPREYYREKVSPLCYCLPLCVCPLPTSLCIHSAGPIIHLLARLLVLAPPITQPLPPIPPFPLTCLFLPASPHPINLPLAPLYPSNTSTRLSAHLTTSTCHSDHLTASAHPSTSAHSNTPAHSLASPQPSAHPSTFVCCLRPHL